LRAKSLTEVKTPRAMTARSILANQFLELTRFRGRCWG
jgi:hypothetical protein